uniref:Uncharacterized protein LOC105128528 n=1 Tax=Rhizophora mucronata TaxID=61149 RepID=A0A2P2K140_RHIMU
MPSKELNRAVRIIGDSYSICKEVLPLGRLTSGLNVHTPDLNPDTLRYINDCKFPCQLI